MTFYYAYCVAEFNNEFGPDIEDFYVKAETLFEQSLEIAQKHNALDIFQCRAEEMVEEACDGWGFKDSLSDIYSEYYQVNSTTT